MKYLHPTSLVSNPRWIIRSTWTEEENKIFESAIAFFDEETPNRWFKVAAMIPGKSVYDVVNQYRELVADVNDIEAGLVPIPGYLYSSFALGLRRKKGRPCDQERKKGVPWTEEEHRRFLLGLQEHGKGDWKNISRNFVVSKTPTQVASHAQKYYQRQLCGIKDKRRPSIHDITTHLVDITSSNDEEKSDELAFVQKPANIFVDWNNNNDGTLMGFDSGCADSSIANPWINIGTRDHYIENFGSFDV